jgi:hypothetical protein
MPVRIALIGVAASLSLVTWLHAQTALRLKITTELERESRSETVHKATTTQHGDVTVHRPRVVDRTEEVVVLINVQNLSSTELKGAVAKYAVFARRGDARNVETVARGEQPLDVGVFKTQTFKTQPAALAVREQKYTTGIGSGFDHREGQRYYGVGVAVYVGDRKIATFCEPSDLEGRLDAALAAAKQSPGGASNKQRVKSR